MKPNWTIPALIALLAIVGFLAYNQMVQLKRIEELELSQAANTRPGDSSEKTPTPKRQVPPDLDPLGSNDDPFAELDRMRERMDQLFRESFGTADPFGTLSPPQSPRVDPIKNLSVEVEEGKEQFVVTVNGVNPDSQNIEVNIDGQTLSLTLKTKESNEENKSTGSGSVSTFSRRSQTYSSSVQLSAPVDVSSMQTNVESDRIIITVQKADS